MLNSLPSVMAKTNQRTFIVNQFAGQGLCCPAPRGGGASRCMTYDLYTAFPYSRSVRFEWDEDKSESNQAKHGISFETAALVFEDPNRLLFIERIEDGEERVHAIGSVRGSYLFLTVVHTYTEEDGEAAVRIISARRATRHERKLYAEAIS
jgi:uncharacterized protein